MYGDTSFLSCLTKELSYKLYYPNIIVTDQNLFSILKFEEPVYVTAFYRADTSIFPILYGDENPTTQ